MLAVAVVLLGLIALLATLQYKWVGRISDAEREHMRSTLNTRAAGFAHDFDSELTRAYMLFQLEPRLTADTLASRIMLRYDRWQSTARYPRIIKALYVTGQSLDEDLTRFNPATHDLDPVAWPATLDPLRAALRVAADTTAPAGTFVVRTIPPSVWESVPALLIPSPMFLFNRPAGAPDAQDGRFPARLSYTVLVMDRDYITRELLPALAQQHFRQTGDGFDYHVAVVSRADRARVYGSTEGFAPKPDADVDAAIDFFQVRMQDFGSIASEVRRFTATITRTTPGGLKTNSSIFREQIVLPPDVGSPAGSPESDPMSVVAQRGGGLSARSVEGGAAEARLTGMTAVARWRLLVKHPSGSLESAVNAVRRRNLIISSSILAVLGASVGLLVLSTRRAQELARQQLEFVATVSHELRTPLAVIRSAGENLADGVVHDEQQIRQYGQLVRNEGRRLTDMVEEILEFAGIESGQRGFALRPVALAPLLREIVDSSQALIASAGIAVEYVLPDRLPPVLGDEAALRRAFQNLIANAIKYGEQGAWMAIRARHTAREVLVTVADRGIGIAPAEHARIFDPFYRAPEVIAAQIQGAGLGLSLVKRIIETHGGRVIVQSAPGAGSEFTVALPAASEEPAGRAALSEAHGWRA